MISQFIKNVLAITVYSANILTFGLASSLPLLAEAELPAFIQTNCLRCHEGDQSEGKFRIDQAPTDVEDSRFGGIWSRVYERINSGEMPPKDEPQPSSDQRYQIIEWITKSMQEWDSTQNAKLERISFKRLTRIEYVHTIEDLLGFTYDPTDPGGLPEDPNSHGMERMGNVLSLTPGHIERYVAAAEFALENVVPLKPAPAPWKYEWAAVDVIQWKGYREKLDAIPNIPKHRLLIGPANNWKHYVGGINRIDAPYSGQYRIQVQASGLRPRDGSVPHLVIYDVNLDRTLAEQDIDAPEANPKVYEFSVWLPKGPHDLVVRNELPGHSPYEPHQRGGNVDSFTLLKNGRAPFLEKVSDDQFRPYVPLLFLDRVTIEAIVDPWPPEAQKSIFIDGDCDSNHRELIVRNFAERAFRRPLRNEELAKYVKIAVASEQSGLSFEESIREALLAVLCAHEFLFLVEGFGGTLRQELNDYELASRLSYFLWSTAPDKALLYEARLGSLKEKKVLSAQVDRMLNDPRSQRFAEDFSRQWLRLNEVGKFPPDKKLYPSYDPGLQRSMIAESQSFFAMLLKENRRIEELLDSDWTMVNNRLAVHYGISGVVDFPMQRVKLLADQHRGGLLTQAAILTMTSDGFRHRPVHRGKWISEVILGIVPPPPPPNAGTIPPPTEGEVKTTLRAKLELHRSQASCAACHEHIDPLGLPFDNYDAIGRWRTVEDTINGAGDPPKIDASGALADGRTYSGPEEFKKLLVDDRKLLAQNLTQLLAQYSLRRTLTFTDKQKIAAIVQANEEQRWKLRSLIKDLVMSDLFFSR